MARVTYGALITELAGSIGGITFQRNSSGSIARLKPNMPVNSTAPQQLQQNKLSQLISQWPSLSSADKLSWETFAGLHNHVNEFSDVKHLSGFQWFMSCNLNLLIVGESVITTAPAWIVLAAPGIFTLSADANNFDITFAAPYVPATDYTILYFTPPLRQSSMGMRKSTFYAGPVVITGTLYIALEVLYASAFNVTWSNIFTSANCSIIVRIKQIQELTGLASPYTSAILKLN